MAIMSGLVDTLIRRRAALYRMPIDGFAVRVARSTQEFEQAFRLVHAAYVYQGYESVREPQLRITPQHVLPEATVLVAYQGDRLVATITVTGDSPAGLPLEKDYPNEIKSLRKDGARLVEYGSLAAVESCWHTGVTTLLNVAAFRVAREAYRATHCVIGINPRAAGFYRAIYQYAPLAEARGHAHLRAPVIGMVQNMTTVESFMRRNYDRRTPSGSTPHEHFFGVPHPCVELPAELSPTDSAKWRISAPVFTELFVSRSNRLATLDGATRTYLAERRRTLRLGPPEA